ncbi:mitochondrial outer membrane protein porin 2 [Gossypium hirsutum]|uniref:Mitochondrial outer membrane protein porin 2 n=1 Tax=Gossypium hirsutum TaxID=3635 RepID=A0ABM2ZDC3_GOSHI|nr:mitochondrial outer membrane protein porin 2-like [Gossypium hirsutum]
MANNSHQRKKKRSKTSKRHKQQEPAGPRRFSEFGKASRQGRRSTANVGAQYKYKNAAVEVNFDTKSSIATTLSFGGEILPSTNVNASLRLPEYGSSQLNLKFQQSFRNATLSISVGLNQSPDILLSATIGTSSIAFGIESKYKTTSRSFGRLDAGISVTNPSRDASIILAEKGDLLRLAYAHRFGQSRKISAVAEVTRRLSNNKNSLAVGVSCIADKLTTVKATLNNRGKLQALLVQKIKPNSSLNISAEFNMKALDKIPRIGLALALRL